MTKVVFNYSGPSEERILYVLTKLTVPPQKGNTVTLFAGIVLDLFEVVDVQYNMKYDFWEVQLDVALLKVLTDLMQSERTEEKLKEVEETMLSQGWTEDFDELLKTLN